MYGLSILGLTNFPITGSLREPILILEGIIILLSVEYGFFFFYKFKKAEGEKNFLFYAWGIFFLTFALMIFNFIMSDFFSYLPEIRQFYLDMGYSSMSVGALFFSIYAEREIKIKNHLFSIILMILVGLLVVSMVIPIISTSVFAFTCWLPFIVLLLIFLKRFSGKIKEKWRINIYGFVVGFILWGSGYGMTIDAIVNAFGYFSRFLGDLLIIMGISMISLLFVGLPSLNEFEWPNKMKKLIIMYKTGVYIADYNFQGESRKNGEILDLPKIIAGGLKGINELISEIVQSKQKLEVMDHKDVKIIFQYGKYLIAAIIVVEVLDIYRAKMKKLIDYLETLYESYLPTWDGDITQFQIVKPIIKRFFTL
ncbi:MAG: hypothetical protein ACTSR3_10755 [Candidatus Helarchaeota archaeon]